MKTIFKILVTLIVAIIIVSSCKTSQAVLATPGVELESKKQAVLAKPGVQLWSENCSRCHYAPAPADFSDQQWDLIATHMQIRGNLTSTESEKIKEFLQSAN